MTESIYTLKKNAFPYNDLSLANPHGLQGGAYFSKLKLLGNTVSLQTPKSKTKNGIIKTDKKIYCDLLFDKEDDGVIEFISELEDKIKNLIYEKKDKWFHTDMDMDTIDYHWQNVLRPYKGSFILLRCFIKKPKSSLHATPPIQIYNEDEQLLDLDKVTKDKSIVSLLDLTGLKFTSQSFSLEFNLTQVMILKDEIKRNKCLIKKDSLEKVKHLEKSNKNIDESQDNANQIIQDQIIQDQKICVSKQNTEDSIIEKIVVKEDTPNNLDNLVENNNQPENNNQTENNNQPENTIAKLKKESDVDEKKLEQVEEFTQVAQSQKIEQLGEFGELEELSELNEINLEIPSEMDSLHLKKPNEVYLEIYKEVRKRAKDAKKKAIEAYLEAKRIKSLYLLNEIESSDDESELLAITEDS
jgi:hypothetical protein